MTVSLRNWALLIACLLFANWLPAQTSDEDFRVYREHPRLLLTAQRLRLLKRERERQSMRWRQFETLAKAAAQMKEPGFVAALYFAVSGDTAQGKRAVEWALAPDADLRQAALVYDWCQPVLSPDQSKALGAKIQRLLDQQSATAQSLPATRDRVLAAIATADDNQHGEEKILRPVVEQWWRGQMAPALLAGHATVAPPDVYPLLEILHAIRDNLKIDLEEPALEYFRELPKYQILANYPAPLNAPENDYWIPVYKEAGQPDLQRAALARAAGLSLVSYDYNALENQYLQGWLMQDRFMLQSAFGAPYEFLWANPYQPGLSYAQLPLFFHDKRSGALFVRSSWDENALWLGLYDGETQLFQDGHITVLTRGGPASNAKPVTLGDINIIQGVNPVQFSLSSHTTLVLGLKPRRRYDVEIDDEELQELETDPAGTLMLENPAGRAAGVHARESME